MLRHEADGLAERFQRSGFTARRGFSFQSFAVSALEGYLRLHPQLLQDDILYVHIEDLLMGSKYTDGTVKQIRDIAHAPS